MRAIDKWDAELADLHARVTVYGEPLNLAAANIAEMSGLPGDPGFISTRRLRQLYEVWSALQASTSE